MEIIQSRRDFLAGASLAAAAGVLGPRASFADEGPPETTTIRLRVEDAPPIVVSGVAENALCTAPLYVTDELLRAEGFTDISYVPVKSGPFLTQAFERSEIDFSTMFAPATVRRLDAGVPITVVAGVHPGCMELFAHDSIRTVTELKGKQVGINDVSGGTDHVFVLIMAAHVGLDPEKDINWVFAEDGVANPKELFVQGKIDAYLSFIAESWQLRARKIGRMIVSMAMDKPWSQYFCCMLAGNRDFVRQYPVATKRAVRAILKATDLCATEPQRAARQLVEDGFARRYDYALQSLTNLPYNVWRELDAEDSLRFSALWLHEFGMIDSTPNRIIAEGTDWRFLNELKRELKA
jgi:NitT/TauT family transport system substrate-binding protein